MSKKEEESVDAAMQVDESLAAAQAKINPNLMGKKRKREQLKRFCLKLKLCFKSKELELAANACRLPHDKMTADEVTHFADIVDESSKNYTENYKTYIYLRNRIVCLKPPF